MRHRAIEATTLLWGLLTRNTIAQSPLPMNWSDTSYGPDGPWHAVYVDIGNEPQTIALYPGGTWETSLLLNTVCNESSDFTCATTQYQGGGLFDPNESETYYDEISLGVSLTEFGWTDAVALNSSATRVLDTITTGGKPVPSADIAAVQSGNFIYPGGKTAPLQLGVLSLGAPGNINQSFSVTDSVPVNGTFMASYYWQQNIIPSYSYGMHIGSPNLKISPSLHLGGYDQARVIGDVSSQPTNGGYPIFLTDIKLGVETGGYPWNITNDMTGLLDKGNDSMTVGTTVQIDPASPYLYLPKSTCKAITDQLPVSYNSDLSLYTWDTNSPQYEKIVSSPTYLGFTFYKDSENNKFMTIKVPFALLNLTLEPPLTSTPVPYFPCMGTDSTYALGRSFLQAAYLGVNFNQSYWFLSQAPGPDSSFIEKVISIETPDKSISSSGNSWDATWSNTWKPLSKTNANSDTSKNSDSENTGLSTGAKAGVGVGCAIAGLLIVGALVWLFLRRRGHYGKTTSQDSIMVEPGFQNAEPATYARPIGPFEAPPESKSRFHELGHYTRDGGWEQPPAEAPAGHRPRFSGYDPNIRPSSKNSRRTQEGPYELSSLS